MVRTENIARRSPEADEVYSGHELYSHGGNGTLGPYTATMSTFVF